MMRDGSSKLTAARGSAPGTRRRPLGAFRVGSVCFLNAVPLTRGLEQEVTFATPSALAGMLERGELDAALVSVTETLFDGRYDVLDGLGIVSRGEVKSILVAHRGPIERAREIYCDPASLTSVNLLRVLLAERGLQPRFRPLPSYDFAALPDYALLIGDAALDFGRASRAHSIWDLGAAWHELTRLPFVYAVWALRRGVENSLLRRRLREAGRLGLETMESIVRERTDYDYAFRKDYLTRCIRYGLGAREKRGLARFAALLRRHGLGQARAPRFVR